MSTSVKKLQANAASQFVSTDAGYPAKIPTLTKPVGANVIDLVSVGNEAPERCRVFFGGVGADNATFTCKLVGWTRIRGDNNIGGADDLWVAVALGEFTLTLSTLVGVAGGTLGATFRFADTLVIIKEPTSAADVTPAGQIVTSSPADNLSLAFADVPLHGVQLLEPIFNVGANTNARIFVAMG